MGEHSIGSTALSVPAAESDHTNVKSSLKNIALSAAFAAIPILSLCLFATLSIYAGNSSEFSASFFESLRVYLPVVMILIGLFGLLGAVMTENGRSRYLSILSAVAVLVWLQGNILVWDYGVLDGREIDWLSGVWRGVMDLAIWVSVLLLAIYAHSRVGKALQFAAIATLAIQLVGAVTTISASPDDLLTRSSVTTSILGREAVFGFSPDRNVVHIVMDGFQSDIFSNIVDDPANGDLKAELSGFTFFRNNVGVYPYTQLTIPALLSGKLYRNHVPVEDFVDDALRGQTILNAAYESGFEVDIAAPGVLANVYNKGKHTYSYGITSSDHTTENDYVEIDSARLMDLALFRVVPHFAKALVYRDELWVFQARVRGADYLQLQYFSDLAFLRTMAEEMTIERDAPVYKMMHLAISHRPTVGNEQCEYDGKRRTSRENVTTQARCGLMRVLEVLQRMKELGIYDSSLIILMADHGAWVPIEFLDRSDANSDGDESRVDAVTVAMATPVLAVKPPGAALNFAISDAPTSIVDVPATVADLLNLEETFEGVSVFSRGSNTPRERRHFVYGYGDNPEAKGYMFPMQEYLINGNPFDGQAWSKGQRFLPAGNVNDDEGNP